MKRIKVSSSPTCEDSILKNLPLAFTGKGEVHGFQFTQLMSSSKAYLYEVRGGGSAYYEIFEHRVNLRFRNVIYPSSRAFGVWAVTTIDFDKAIGWFDKITDGAKVSKKSTTW